MEQDSSREAQTSSHKKSLQHSQPAITQGEEMEFHIEFTNTAASIAWALCVFLIAGLSISNRKK
jgi:hypothetical protein